jgi:AbrB family looped-hinge helix DNA binding protein
MSLTKVGPKFQVTIPKDARLAVGLAVGDVVEATVTKNGVLLRPQVVMDKSAFATLQQQAKRSGKDKLSMKEIEAEIRTVRKARTAKRSA